MCKIRKKGVQGKKSEMAAFSGQTILAIFPCFFTKGKFEFIYKDKLADEVSLI